MSLSKYTMHGMMLLLMLYSHLDSTIVQRQIPMSADQIENSAALTPNPVFQRDSDFFLIGGIFSLTSEALDTIASPGVQRLEAFRYAVGLANSMGSQWPGGRNITFTYNAIDSQNDQSEALAASMTFINRNITTIIGPSASDEAFNVANLVSDYDVTVISYGATASSAAPSARYYYIRTMPDDIYQVHGMIAMLNDLGWNLVSLIYTNDTYGSLQRSHYYAATSQYYINTTCEYSVPFAESLEDIPIVKDRIGQASECIANSIANVVVVLADMDNIRIIMSVLKDNPLNDRLTFVSATWAAFYDNPVAYSYLAFPLSFMEGALSVTPTLGNTTGFKSYFYNLTPSNNNYSQFLQFWQVNFRCLIKDMSVPVWGIFSSNEADAHVQDLPYCSNNLTDRGFPIRCFCTGAENLSSIALDPSVGYVEDAVQLLTAAVDRIVNNCGSIAWDNYCAMSNVTGAQILSVIREFPLNGTTGYLSFSGINRIDANYDVIQFFKNATAHIVGNYSPTAGISINNSLLVFKGEGIPTSTLILENTTFTSFIGIFVSSLATILIVVCIASMIFFYQRRREKVIKKSSPVFCQLMLLGIIMVNMGLILWTFKQTAALCVVKAWVTVIGFGLIMGNLLAKTYRVFKIFTNVKVTITSIRDYHLLQITACVILIELALLCTYTFADGTPQAVLLVSTVDPLYTYVSCQVASPTFQIAMVATILAYNAVLIILAGLVAFLTRHVDSAYNESKFIGITVYVYFLLAVIAVPLYYTAARDTSLSGFEYAVRSITTLVAMFFTWIMLFGPKCAQIAKQYHFFTHYDSTSRIVDREVASQSRTTEFASTLNTAAANDSRFISSTLWRGNRRKRTCPYPGPLEAPSELDPSSVNANNPVSQTLRYIQMLEAEVEMDFPLNDSQGQASRNVRRSSTSSRDRLNLVHAATCFDARGDAPTASFTEMGMGDALSSLSYFAPVEITQPDPGPRALSSTAPWEGNPPDDRV